MLIIQINKNKVSDNEFISSLHDIPLIITRIYYGKIKETNCKIPRKASVLKVLKENLKLFIGYEYKNLTENQKTELLYIAEDAYNGIREGE